MTAPGSPTPKADDQKLIELTLEPAAAPLRLDQALLFALQKEIPGLSRAELKRWFQEGRITVGSRQGRPSDLLAGHALRIRVHAPIQALRGAGALAQASSSGSFLRVLYEDSDLLALDKPSGIPSVPHSSTETETAVGSALAHFSELAGVGESGLEPGLLHRLDTGTSGILLFAKTQGEWERLRALWAAGQVRKTYRAWVTPSGEPRELPRLPAELKPFLAHDAKSARKMICLGEDLTKIPEFLRYRGKPLRTRTWIHRAWSASPVHADLEIEIETGVMHQIRCTLAALGWPVSGDSIYHGAPAPRLWLHAWKLSFQKKEGTELELESPLPSNWPSN